MKKVSMLIVLVLVAMVAAPLAAGGDRWINVHVQESHDNTNVEVRLPMAMLAVALDCVETEQLKNGKLKLDFHDTKIDFKKLWQELRKYDNTDFVKVKSDKEQVFVSRQGDLFLIKVYDRIGKDGNPDKAHTKVTVKLPVKLVDALMMSDDNEIDLKAFLNQLSEIPSGDLVEVQEKDTHVRIWID